MRGVRGGSWAVQAVSLAGAALALVVALSGCGVEPPPERTGALEFRDVLDLTGTPDSARDASVYAFGDLGAWHMFGLPDPSRGDPLGGFTGPLLLMDGGVWLARSLVGFSVWLEDGDAAVEWTSAGEASVASFPGLLRQELAAGDLRATLELVFVSERSALVSATLENAGGSVLRLATGWVGEGTLIPAAMAGSGGAVRLDVEATSTAVEVRSGSPAEASVTQGPAPAYRLRGAVEQLAPGARVTRRALVSAYETEGALEADRARRDGLLEDAESDAAAQARRWDGYLTSVLGRLRADAPPAHRRIAVKAVQTLVSNWRSPLGALRHAGLFPSYAYAGFHGIWAWDSWKHARALALFAPELAREQIRVMLARQDAAGMVPDVIYADSAEDNWRDTKPPLAAWAVAGVLDATGDTAFVRDVYPALAAYHAWWYAHRDHDGNGLCEYGSTDGTRIAAAWESGMDNAVRFDSAAMVLNHEGAWSLDQESVDLNSYLHAEKSYLAALADAVGRPEEAAAYRRDAATLAARIRNTMFDEETGWFYDVRMESGEPVRVQGPEGWIPLWAGVATPEQAGRVALAMMDSARFLAPMPLPTLSMERPEFDPSDGYWRGPVWLDQAYFGVRGLERYGLTREAGELRARLLGTLAGPDGGTPLFENYDPRTGRGLNAPHFSWSAAHLLMLLDARDAERP